MRRPVNSVADGPSASDWFNSIGLCTKILLLSTLFSGTSIYLRLLSPSFYVFSWQLVWNQFEIWRLVTPFIFAGGFGFPYAMHLYMLYLNSSRYETSPFDTGARGSSADYLWMLILCMGMNLLVGHFFQLMILSDSLLFTIMYVWSRREPNAMTNFWGFPFKVLYLPWVLLGVRLLFGNPIVACLVGIAVGHAYYFLVDVLPNTHHIDVVRTPEFCINFVEYCTGFTHPNHQIPVNNMRDRGTSGSAGQPRTGGHNWGSGHVLGGGGGNR